MHPLTKMLIGIILLLVPLGLYAYEFYRDLEPITVLGIDLPLLIPLRTVLLGIIPPFLMLIGLFIIWLELDEWRIEKELKAEEEKEKKRKKKKK
jgi:hypothetical protein